MFPEMFINFYVDYFNQYQTNEADLMGWFSDCNVN